MGVVDEIILNKKEIIKKEKDKKSLFEIKKEAEDKVSTIDNSFRFLEEFKKNDYTKIIAEFKPASPSKGHISSVKVEDVMNVYNQVNVDMISCLTEESYFKSNLSNLKKAVDSTDKPVLRKDFVIDEYMVYEAAIAGASCILLISDVCPDMEKYMGIANDLGLDTLVECHSKEEIEAANDLNAPIIGINNRDLSNFTIDFNTTKDLGQYVKSYLVSESGVNTVEDGRLLQSYGADGLLIGTALLRNKSIDETKEFVYSLNKGFTRC